MIDKKELHDHVMATCCLPYMSIIFEMCSVQWKKELKLESNPSFQSALFPLFIIYTFNQQCITLTWNLASIPSLPSISCLLGVSRDIHASAIPYTCVNSSNDPWKMIYSKLICKDWQQTHKQLFLLSKTDVAK